MKITGEFAVELEAVSGTEVALTVTNIGAEPGTFCTYYTPFEGITNNIFVVKRGDVELPYRGPLASRPPPRPEDFEQVKPGDVKGPVTVDLAVPYGLTSGTFTVRFRGISGLPDSNDVQLVVP